MIFDHIVVNITDIEKSKRFYAGALAPLGIVLIKEEDGCIGFGNNGKPSFWICNHGIAQKPMHIAFTAPDRKSIDDFHSAGLLAGGKDNGEAKLREHYHPNYYGAYLLDPDGHNIEAVYRLPVTVSL